MGYSWLLSKNKGKFHTEGDYSNYYNATNNGKDLSAPYSYVYFPDSQRVWRMVFVSLIILNMRIITLIVCVLGHLDRNRIFCTLLFLTMLYSLNSCKEGIKDKSNQTEVVNTIIRSDNQSSAKSALSKTLFIELSEFVQKNPIKPKSNQIYLIWFWQHTKDTLLRLERSLKPNVYKKPFGSERDLKAFKGGFYVEENPVLVIDEEKLLGAPFYDISKLDKSMSDKFNQKETFRHSDVYTAVEKRYRIKNGSLEAVE